MSKTASPIIEHAKPFVGMATEATDRVFRQVSAIARRVKYDPHPTRTKAITYTEGIVTGAVAVTVLLVRKRNHS